MTSSANSMRFSHDELLAGLLATLEGESFGAEPDALRATFAAIAAEFPLFAPFNGGDDSVGRAIAVLVDRNALLLKDGSYLLTADGRAACVSSKRTLFNSADRTQLEGAAALLSAA